MAETKRVVENLDWVKARHECSIAYMFAKLKTGVNSDVDTRNAQLGPNSSLKFKFKDNNGDGFDVLRYVQGEPRGDTFLYFSRDETAIFVSQCLGAKPFIIATLTLGDDGDCRFNIQYECRRNEAKQEFRERECWQLRRLALEDFLFD